MDKLWGMYSSILEKIVLYNDCTVFITKLARR